MMLDSLLFELAPTGMSYVELIFGSIGVLSTGGLDRGFLSNLAAASSHNWLFNNLGR